jgi:hypothetical protein
MSRASQGHLKGISRHLKGTSRALKGSLTGTARRRRRLTARRMCHLLRTCHSTTGCRWTVGRWAEGSGHRMASGAGRVAGPAPVRFDRLVLTAGPCAGCGSAPGRRVSAAQQRSSAARQHATRPDARGRARHDGSRRRSAAPSSTATAQNQPDTLRRYGAARVNPPRATTSAGAPGNYHVLDSKHKYLPPDFTAEEENHGLKIKDR